MKKLLFLILLFWSGCVYALQDANPEQDHIPDQVEVAVDEGVDCSENDDSGNKKPQTLEELLEAFVHSEIDQKKIEAIIVAVDAMKAKGIPDEYIFKFVKKVMVEKWYKNVRH